MPRSRPSSFLLVPVALLAVLVAGSPPLRAGPIPADAQAPGAPGAGGSGVVYQPPVAAPVVDPFRAPTSPYGPGNRGLEYATTPGTPVGAIADGLVVFAGPVAGALHVTVLHADGVRSSYSFLAQVLVTLGQRVARGQPVGLAGTRLHLGARTGPRTYLDPATLWGGPPHVYLVPPDGAAGSPSGEGGEQGSLAGAVRIPAPVAALAAGQAGLAARPTL